MGDGESAEGSVWETAQWAALHNLNNLCAIIDINRLGQSQPTMLQWELAIYKARWEAFSWQVLLIDGHSIPDLITAFESATQVTDGPTIVLAQTLKGKGLIGIEGLEGWHGKVLDKPTAAKVIAELESNLSGAGEEWKPNLPPTRRNCSQAAATVSSSGTKPPYAIGGEEVATRNGFADGLAALANADPWIVVLNGDVKLGDAVLWALAEEPVRAYKLAVRKIPHSEKPEELIAKFGISSGHIVSAVKAALG